MKKILSIAFALVIVVTCWSGYNNFNNNVGTFSTIGIDNVEAISGDEHGEPTIFCQKPYGVCWELDEYGNCRWSGCQSDYCS